MPPQECHGNTRRGRAARPDLANSASCGRDRYDITETTGLGLCGRRRQRSPARYGAGRHQGTPQPRIAAAPSWPAGVKSADRNTTSPGGPRPRGVQPDAALSAAGRPRVWRRPTAYPRSREKSGERETSALHASAEGPESGVCALPDVAAASMAVATRDVVWSATATSRSTTGLGRRAPPGCRRAQVTSRRIAAS